ncbi:MAG: sulfite dehydrogenase, partial [Candidatus Acidiferrales bacterium]
VSTDAGRTWSIARLTGPVLPIALTRFRLPWRWDGAATTLVSRATDETGAVQPSRADWLAQFAPGQIYHNNSVQAWGIEADGTVKNVYV